MMAKAERLARDKALRAFPGSEVSSWRDRRGFVARIDHPRGSWCSTRGRSAGSAIRKCLALALEPAPGFPGWIEPRAGDVVEDTVILT